MLKPITPPTDRQTCEGEIASYWLEDGILVSLSKSLNSGQCDEKFYHDEEAKND